MKCYGDLFPVTRGIPSPLVYCSHLNRKVVPSMKNNTVIIVPGTIVHP